jgi:hypothetical protein
MRVTSEWVFDCEPEHVWPHFLEASMDDEPPLMFRLGIPKPLSCRVLDGAVVGGTRQCTTDRGTSEQRILSVVENRKLHYRMLNSSMVFSHWVQHLEDTFTLAPFSSGATLVSRTTRFTANGPLRPLKQLAIWIFLRTTHSYAARNWRRLSYGTKNAERVAVPVAS